MSEEHIESKYQLLLKSLPDYEQAYSSAITSKATAGDIFLQFGQGEEHEAIITGSKLGMTVENVLERTVVHEVEPNGPAAAAGVAKGELLIGIGKEIAVCMTHDEAIERLRLPHRPLKLKLRRVSMTDLQNHRAEMGELVKSNIWNAYTSSTDDPIATIKWVFTMVETSLKLLIHGTRLQIEKGEEMIQPPCLTDDEDILDMDQPMDLADRLSHFADLLQKLNKIENMENEQKQQQQQQQQSGASNSIKNGVRSASPPPPNYAPGSAAAVAAMSSAMPHPPPSRPPRRSKFGATGGMSLSTYQKQFDAVKTVLSKLVAVVDWNAEPTRVVSHDLATLAVICLDLSHSHLFSPHLPPSNNAAEKVLCSIFKAMNKSLLPAEALPVLFYLANSPGRSQQACCALIPIIFDRVDSAKQLLMRGIMDRFLKKELPVPIRCRVLQCISDIMPKADTTTAAWLVRVCVRSANDSDAKVRRAMCQTLTQLTLNLDDILKRGGVDVEADAHIFRCKLVPLIQRASEDNTWQVREACAYNIGGLCEGFGERWSALLIDLLQNLMADGDLRVKCAAICALPRVAGAAINFEQAKSTKEKEENALKQSEESGGIAQQEDKSEAAERASRLLSSQLHAIETLMPHASVLIEDPSPDVRSALAWVLCQLLALMNEAAYLYDDLESDSDRYGGGGEGDDEAGEGGAGGLGSKCPEYEELQERLDTTVFPLLLILLHDEDTSVATSCLRSMALTAAAYPPPPPATADGTVANTGTGSTDTDESFPLEKPKAPPSPSLDRQTSGSFAAASQSNEGSESSTGGLDPRPLKQRRKRLPLLSVRHVGKLLPTVQDVGSHRDWRLREWAVAVVPVLHAAASVNISQSDVIASESSQDREARAQAASFRTQLLDLTIKALVDPAESVRRRAVEGFIGIGRQLITDAALQASKVGLGRSSVKEQVVESDWVEKTLVPNTLRMITSPVSKERLIGVLMCERALILLLGGRPSDATTRNGSLSPLDEDDDDEFLRLSAYSTAPGLSKQSPAHAAAHSACKNVLPLLLQKGCTDRLPTVRLRSAMALEFLFTMRLRPESPTITYSLPTHSSGSAGGVTAVKSSNKSTSLRSSNATVAGLRRRFSMLLGEANAGDNSLGDEDLLPAAKKMLTMMCEDKDEDVKHFARRALKAADAAANAVAEALAH